ncbi:MAG: SGNH/GDSL hydrolase family protein [Acidobacteria bacterium]|nr:SGNH/GDSL hydrolase family protein [Acidobacteriota bacterium]
MTRIVVCGDSHAFGWGVDDGKRLTDYVSSSLSKRLSQPIEVLNLAQPGASFPDYVLCAENTSALGAIALVVVVYAGNDFGETVARGAPRKESSLRPNAPLRGRDFLRTLYLWHLPARAFAYFSKPSEFLIGEAGCQARIPWADWGPYWQALFQSCVLHDDQTLESAKLAAAKAVERAVTSAGCPVLIALLPSRLMTHQTDAVEQANRVGGAVGADAASAASSEAALTRNFLEVSAQRTRYVIDLTSTVADTPNAYFPIDWHLSEGGHKAVGEALAAKVSTVMERKE